MLPAQAQSIHHAGPEVAGHDVGLPGQLEDQVAARVRLDVDADAPFVAVGCRPVRAVALIKERRLETTDLAAVDTLDLDHVGAEVGEHLRG